VKEKGTKPMQDKEPVNETDLYRAVLFTTCGTRVLVVSDEARLRLPTLPVPKYRRIAEHLTASLESEWAQRAICLFRLDWSPPAGGVRYFVMQSSEPNLPCAPRSHWVAVSSLDERQFHETSDYTAIAESLRECGDYAEGRKPGVFARLGSFSEIDEWVREAAAPEGLTLSGRFSQFNAGPAFSLVRFETCGPALWFKAVGEPNLREFSITRALASSFPAFLPAILAFRDEWKAWIGVEAEGEHPDRNSLLHVWVTVAARLADLQISSMGRTLHLADVGCHDARIFALSDLVKAFLEAMAELMDQQTKPTPKPLRRDELNALGGQVHDLLSDAAELEVPNTVGHLDFSPGNIVVSPDRCVFLDWAEGCIGHPFITFEYLLEHFRRCQGIDHSAESVMTKTYLDAWRPFLSPEQSARAMILSPVLAVFAYAVSSGAWRHPTSLHPDTARHLRSLTRRLKNEVDRCVAGHKFTGRRHFSAETVAEVHRR
jgi:hypothetical protein